METKQQFNKKNYILMYLNISKNVLLPSMKLKVYVVIQKSINIK